MFFGGFRIEGLGLLYVSGELGKNGPRLWDFGFRSMWV